MNAPSPWDFGWTQVLTIVGFLITLGIAFGGFRTFGRWRREQLEGRRIEVALELLSLAYEAKYVFEYIRNPAAFDYEWQDMPEVEGETTDERRARQPFYAILRRMNRSNDFFERAFKLQPRCMALFGTSAEEIFLLMHEARRNIEVSAQMLSRRRAGWSHEQRNQMEHDIWDMGDFEREHDRVGPKLASFRERIEALCRPIIDREFGRRGARWWKKKKSPATGSSSGAISNSA